MNSEDFLKIILSKPRKPNTPFTWMAEDLPINISEEPLRIEVLQNNGKIQASMFTKTKVFHKNFTPDEVKSFLDWQLSSAFLQLNLWDGEHEYQTRITKKGKRLTSRTLNPTKPGKFLRNTLDREKNTIIKEGDIVPVLVEMGIFTKELRVAAPMQDKFRQINRFLELLDDVVKHVDVDQVNILDFGCGKSYLTFLVHHYFTNVCNTKVSICGLDNNPDVVRKCSATTERFGLTSIQFIQGEIGELKEPPIKEWGAENTYNIVISLHACDTATDLTLFNAIKWQADLICAVPCCQHELRDQMKPKTLKIMGGYGIIKERFASLATDAIRAKLLEYCGYRVQIIEFTPTENTPKNLFIRAVRLDGKPKPSAMKDINDLVSEFGFKPSLLELIEGYI